MCICKEGSCVGLGLGQEGGCRRKGRGELSEIPEKGVE